MNVAATTCIIRAALSTIVTRLRFKVILQLLLTHIFSNLPRRVVRECPHAANPGSAIPCLL